MKKYLILLVLVSLLVGCGRPSTSPSTDVKGEIILTTTTSTENSGLLDAILGDFTEKTGIEVKVVAVGSGKALQMGMDGEADVLLVHAKASEEAFVADGHGLERFDVMYNDFIIIGPDSDPAKLKDIEADVLKGFEAIINSSSKFISRGDDSGTHKQELSLWKKLNVEAQGDFYISAGRGMGDVIMMADELEAYTLTDRATYLSMVDKVESVILLEGDSLLFNQYGVIAVNPNKNDKINSEGANLFVEWILSDSTQELIREFGVDTFGQSLFIPNAK
ncbi:substrate-binding domain-containing protein [Serpentinicella alkaliphila]|uniref:Tungstate transport system substrate-binding protein n=1 Tax=Serpentinicella alkaliphila TaxID=1734049 RepID=A0A4R2UCS8_9FIRM|nr:substrate-binding domain-containing protein [Serpentinicella alkaliphila]QUH26850.1 substrate-binding domain-containing protein [Serpentinicella alkaliphila]TCQ08079.1 tungstate transport system substrate-binding protein [Serpentinicella alkaliphila]